SFSPPPLRFGEGVGGGVVAEPDGGLPARAAMQRCFFSTPLLLLVGLAASPVAAGDRATIWKPALLLDADGNAVHTVAFSADGRTTLTGHEDGNVGLWNADTGLRMLSLKTHKARIHAGHFVDGKTLLTVSEEDIIRWENGKPAEVLPWEVDERGFVVLSSDGRQAAAGMRGGRICIGPTSAEVRT